MSNKKLGVLWLLLLGAVILWLSSYFVVWWLSSKDESAGNIGDTFGAINALFSGLAFAGVIYSLYVQSKDLELQRFETSFFQMLTLQSDIVKSMDVRKEKNNEIISTGRDVFRTYYNQLEKTLSKFRDGNPILDFGDGSREHSLKFNYKIPLKTMVKKYDSFFRKRESDLGHYFRSLYHIYRYLDDSNIEDKMKYARIIRSQLSIYELLFLFYNGLSEAGEGFKDQYMDKYQVLKNMSWERIFDKTHILQYEHLKDGYQKSSKKIFQSTSKQK